MTVIPNHHKIHKREKLECKIKFSEKRKMQLWEIFTTLTQWFTTWCRIIGLLAWEGTNWWRAKLTRSCKRDESPGPSPTDVERTVKQTLSVLWPAVMDVGRVSYDSDGLFEREVQAPYKGSPMWTEPRFKLITVHWPWQMVKYLLP